ncbi:hypothetical protein [Pseudooceanicola sp.]|uniref:hypothetical protein n=1 Tax=Pseudooceanicola sp. TaxID=1914328 RepID=UPI000C0A811C|nr:amidophosphoribosyltransferase [Pseudooceanicola sp.]
MPNTPDDRANSTTPANVAKMATEAQALDLGGVALLGTMVETTGPKALLRLENGTVRKVAPGDRIGMVRVRAIGEGIVQITSLGAVETLSMPNG